LGTGNQPVPSRHHECLAGDVGQQPVLFVPALKQRLIQQLGIIRYKRIEACVVADSLVLRYQRKESYGDGFVISAGIAGPSGDIFKRGTVGGQGIGKAVMTQKLEADAHMVGMSKIPAVDLST